MKEITKTQNFMLSTFDNSINPFDDFEAWFKTDMLLGHNCCGLLASEANTSDVSSDEVNEELILLAAKEIVKRFPTIYRIVTKDDYATK